MARRRRESGASAAGGTRAHMPRSQPVVCRASSRSAPPRRAARDKCHGNGPDNLKHTLHL
ncbi:hypothetical protein MSG28_010596 [Choristoneura fumiferana]|uniref:Uncharacterized protein n=1 Tax=Choristoneura fumiferana TaxID=7141 RepID=A0ACC0KP33_CHOFU|nr:hypothetical protein MSG28_010596 [Choristoneura fumiferana]